MVAVERDAIFKFHRKRLIDQVVKICLKSGANLIEQRFKELFSSYD